jgi:hypothetical protein
MICIGGSVISFVSVVDIAFFILVIARLKISHAPVL